MKKSLVSLCIGLTVLISCNKIQSPEIYMITGEIKNFEGEVYLSPVVDTLYYAGNFKQDTATVVDGKIKFLLSSKFKTPMPFILRTDNSMSSAFILEPKNHKIIIDNTNGRLKIVYENSILNDQQKIISERMKSSREALNSAMKNMYNSNFSNDSIQKLSAIAQGKFKEETLLIIAEFSKDYPKSYVSFWHIAMGQMYYGYDIALENAYENLSGEIKKSDVAILFEQKMLMSKMSQTGSTFP